jgi:GT2 family glycosyltransferase
VIVDDGSTDGSAEFILQNYPDVEVLRFDGNQWWTGAINRGIEHSLKNHDNLKAVILQNDDVLVEQDWIHTLIKTADENPRSLIGCATSVCESKDLICYGGRRLDPWFAKETKVNFRAQRSAFKKGFVIDSFDLYGRGLYIPIEVFQQLGLFDEKRFRHRGDMDIPLRAKKAGFRLLVSYDAIVYELPEHSFALDSKKKLTFREIYKSLTDFRSSNNINFIYNYSDIATHGKLQFVVFFLSNFYYNFRGICWRYLKQWIPV